MSPIGWLAVWLMGINGAAFLLCRADKRRAQAHLWRIPEATLLWLAALGGELGLGLSMQLYRHKTQHLRFRLAVPFFLLLHLTAAYVLCKRA